MPPTQADDERELADAIITGAHRRPAQSFGSYFGPEGGSCALGAAFEGIYLLPQHAEGTHPERLDRFFHCIDYVARRCPAGCKKSVPIGALIVHLNDDHRWTREQIAAWLRGERVFAAPAPSTDAQAEGQPQEPGADDTNRS